jgi:PAS domain S-box-containing protein
MEPPASEILESLSDACMVIDNTWRYTYVNSAAEGLANVGRKNILGRSIWEVSPESAPKLEAACLQASRESAPIHLEEYRAPLNTWFEHTVYFSALGFTVCTRDVTERKRIEDALRESEELFRRYFELGLIGMAITSPTKGILEVNDRICEILGYERTKLLRLTWAELTHPDDLAADIENFNRVMAGEIDGYSMDKRWIRKDGQVIDATISVKCLRWPDGSVRYFVSLFEDITERKQMEATLREKERFIRQILELTPVLINVFDLVTERDTYIGPQVINLVGYKPDEISEMNDPFALWHPEDIPRVKDHLARSKWAADGEISELEYRIRRRDGEWRWFSTSSMPFARNEKGRVREIVTATLDITDHKQVEDASRASEERLRLLVESAEDYAIMALDTEGRISTWNSGATRMFGYVKAEIIGRPVEILFTPEDRQLRIPLEELKRTKEEGRMSDEHYYLRKDRTRFFATGVTAVLRDHGGLGYVKITRDLTERKQAEDALRRAHEELEQRVAERTKELTILNDQLRSEISERKLAQDQLRRSEAYLAEAQRLSHTASWAWNTSAGELFWSDEHFRILGIAPSEAAPPFPEAVQYIHPEDRPFAQQVFDRSIRERSDFEVNCRVVRPDGTIRHIHSRAHPVFDKHGSLTEYVGAMIDVTEQRQTELNLRESERRFRLLLESIPHHVWSFRTDGSVGYWNQRLIDYTGLTAEELQHGSWTALHPDDVERVRAAWREAWSKGALYEQEQRIRGRDGRYRRFLCRGVPVPGERGQVREWFGTDTDIEDLTQAEEALRDIRTELTHIARVITMGELTASIAHEVSQPLTAVIVNGNACVHWLARDPPNLQEVRKALAGIVNEANRANDVLSRIRTFVKRSPKGKGHVDINGLIQETIAFITGELIKNQAVLHVDLASDVLPVLGDRIQLQQVILNLLMNAIEAISARDGPREVLVTTQMREPHQIVISVRDSGLGIDLKSLDQLFKPFFTTKPSGMGMGLSISRSLIEAHGGRLWAEPNDTGGATFQFSLPANIET